MHHGTKVLIIHNQRDLWIDCWFNVFNKSPEVDQWHNNYDSNFDLSNSVKHGGTWAE